MSKYLKEIPDGYHCDQCEAKNVRLYRKYQTFDTNLLCRSCTIDSQDKEPSNEFEHEIGWRVAAVPLVEGGGYWGFTSVPQAGVDWWDALPKE